jgi:predicted dehydrogenase
MAGTKQDTLKIGVIGAGNMGGTHARCWNRLPGARVMAIADPQTGKAKALAAHLIEARTNGGPAPAVLGGADELIAHADVDVVSVCVPTHLHRPVVEAALRAGKHVLCEKPMALTLADCDVMLKAAKQSGTVFTVGQVVRCFPEFARAKAMVDAGTVGKPAAVRVRRGGDFPRADTDWYAQTDKSGGRDLRPDGSRPRLAAMVLRPDHARVRARPDRTARRRANWTTWTTRC